MEEHNITDDKLLHKWLQDELSDEEMARFRQRPEYSFLTELQSHTDTWKTPAFDSEGVLENIMNSKMGTPIAPQQTKGRVISLTSFVKYGVAACLALAIAIFLWPSGNVTFGTDYGQLASIELPDQSKVMLNAQSEITYNKKEWEVSRTLELQGEAFFEVRKGSTFKVLTSIGEVTVLGTRFNVRVRNQSFLVSCEEGSVSVEIPQLSQRLVLEAGQGCRTIDLKPLERYTSDETASWRSGISRFRNVPLSEVLTELRSQFGVKISTDNIDLDQMLSCNFENGDLNNALKSVLTPLNLKFEINDSNEVTIFN